MRFVKPILVDTNVILEGHSVGFWNMLAGAFHLETVEECILETQSGKQARNPELVINEESLRKSFKTVHTVSQKQIAKVLTLGGAALDYGERALWAHAFDRKDAWILCGPDKASMRFGFQNGFRERLVSLGELLKDGNINKTLRPHFEKQWLDNFIRDLILGSI